jgi:predicted DNA binding CopG/RHH family protein
MNDAILNMKIPSELMKLIKSEAAKKRISYASFVRMVLSDYFEKADCKDGKKL